MLETLHFNSITVDTFNATGNKLKHQTKTEVRERECVSRSGWGGG